MLTPFQDPTLASECRDVEFLLYGGNNRLYTVHGDHLIKLWTLPLYDPTQECRLYRVFVAEGTVRNIHVVKRHPVNRLSTPGSLAMEDGFLSCEFTERGNHVSVWNVENGASEKIKGLSSSYMGSDVRVCSVLYLSSHILAVLISDQGIVHAIDIWNTRTGVCVHGIPASSEHVQHPWLSSHTTMELNGGDHCMASRTRFIP
ncbi:hypothetical protein M8J77_017760 [Diaphorina citri]|nr:hypothetical protein M8J77_017760 [Diaphorina citri]